MHKKIHHLFLLHTLVGFIVANIFPLTLYGCDDEQQSPTPSANSAGPSQPIKALPGFSKLVFHINDVDSVEFHAHECVAIAQELLKETNTNNLTAIPPYKTYEEQIEEEFDEFNECLVSKTANFYGISDFDLKLVLDVFYKGGPSLLFSYPDLLNLWSSVMKKIKAKQTPVPQFLKECTEKNILPVQINPTPTALGWLDLARYIALKNEDAVSGWWINIGNRLILLRNLPSQRQHFYVSDHGNQEEIFTLTKDVFSNSFTKEGQSDQLSSTLFCKFYNKLSKDEKCLFRQRFLLLLNDNLGGNTARNEFLLYALALPRLYFERVMENGQLNAPYFNVRNDIGMKEHKNDPSVFPLSAEEVEILHSLKDSDCQKYNNAFEHTLERIRHRGDIQTSVYYRHLFNSPGGGLSAFFTQIDNIFHRSDAEHYRIFFVLKEIAKQLGKGQQEFLFRPLYSFGSREEGESYRGFFQAFDEYFRTEVALSDHELAQEVRSLLQGNPLKNQSLYFLPNLIAAWFISETARNEVSLLSSLMLLDLIESQVPLADEHGHNRYSWRYTLVHPHKPADSRTKVPLRDLYGNHIDLAQFDGIHPMAHGGSVPHSKTKLANQQKLTPVQQKEGHLIIHWLFSKLKNPLPDTPIYSSVVADPISPNGTLITPDYKEIKKLLAAKDKPSNAIKKDNKLKIKWGILQIIKESLKERLGTLSNLLNNNNSALQEDIVDDTPEAEDSLTLSLNDAPSQVGFPQQDAAKGKGKEKAPEEYSHNLLEEQKLAEDHYKHKGNEPVEEDFVKTLVPLIDNPEMFKVVFEKVPDSLKDKVFDRLEEITGSQNNHLSKDGTGSSHP
jgi:hypothetical protein